MATVTEDNVHLCDDACDCFIECKECGEPFCALESGDGLVECLDHFGGSWDIRNHSCNLGARTTAENRLVESADALAAKETR